MPLNIHCSRNESLNCKVVNTQMKMSDRQKFSGETTRARTMTIGKILVIAVETVKIFTSWIIYYLFPEKKKEIA